MEHNSCVICQSTVALNNQIDIQLTTTKLGQVNVEEFLKETILGVHVNIKLRSNFLCQQCYAAINTLEDHFITYKSIQQSLIAKYSKDSKFNLENVFIDDVPETKQDLEPNPNIPDLQKNQEKQNSISSIDSNQTNLVDIFPQTKATEETKCKERKSSRKRKSIPNYAEEEDSFNQKTKKTKPITKSSQQATKFDDFPILAPNPEYCCEICGKQYLNYNGFNIHRRKHRNENLIRCEYCDKTFAQKGGLRRHLHRHTGTFPYECDLCDKKFIHQSSLKIHKDIHDGRRDHICEICAMAFYSKTDLKRHINRHTKEKMHECETCGAMFTEKYNLNVHIQKVHGIKD